MKLKDLLNKVPPAWRRRPLVAGVLAAAALCLLWLWLRPAAPGADTACHEVKRGDLTVTVVEGGTLAAVTEVSIRNEVEGTARIISIVPEGSFVKKGDLLVELDSAQAKDQVNVQEIAYEKARFAFEQASAQLEIQQSVTNSDYLAADLKLKFAKIDRDKYERGQRLVDLVEASNKVVQAQSELSVNLDTYINSTNLAAKGYETKQKVDGDRLGVLNSHNAFIVATNNVWLLKEFDLVKQIQKFAADVRQAEQELERVIIQNERRMAQYQADLLAQSNTLELSRQKLERDKKNLAATRICAPQDGLVVYAVTDSHFSSESLIEGGAVVRNRQELIKLPDLARMKLTVKVHESHVNAIHPGLPAYVILDSMPQTRFAAVVEKVAPLPDTQSRWGNPNLKVYNTDIHITDPLPNNTKPGVSGSAEIIVTNIPQALSVPIHAITTYKGKPAVYLMAGGAPEPRPVEVGQFNTKFIEVVKGLEEGDRVLLSPPFNSQERDLEGGVLTAEEKARLAPGNGGRGPAAGGGTPAAKGAGAMAGANGTEPKARPPGLPNGTDAETIRRFDKDGDGKLNEAELAASRASRERPPGTSDAENSARPREDHERGRARGQPPSRENQPESRPDGHS